MRKTKTAGFIFLIFLVLSCQSATKDKKNSDKAGNKSAKAKVTFIELGSVKCIPCKAMQPVMKAIEKEYGEQINVVFYDVWEDDSWAKKYDISVIPTQVFLDENGAEFFRHQGFYPQAEIEQLLSGKGLKPLKDKKD
ncbi:thioredoxin family protein [candidate division KSB1 bacterium]|nr:thioredoxin family protein [candidate division KSB1 bacterium]